MLKRQYASRKKEDVGIEKVREIKLQGTVNDRSSALCLAWSSTVLVTEEMIHQKVIVS